MLTACQSACPTNAIVFGDINDPNSRVAQLKRNPLNYPLLAELSRKYVNGREIPLEAVTSGYLWLYELAPRS